MSTKQSRINTFDDDFLGKGVYYFEIVTSSSDRFYKSHNSSSIKFVKLYRLFLISSWYGPLGISSSIISMQKDQMTEERDILDLIYMSEPIDIQNIWKRILLYNYNVHICDGIKDIEFIPNENNYRYKDNAYDLPNYNIKKVFKELNCGVCGKPLDDIRLSKLRNKDFWKFDIDVRTRDASFDDLQDTGCDVKMNDVDESYVPPFIIYSLEIMTTINRARKAKGDKLILEVYADVIATHVDSTTNYTSLRFNRFNYNPSKTDLIKIYPINKSSKISTHANHLLFAGMQTLKYNLDHDNSRDVVKMYPNELKLFGATIEPISIITNKTLYDYKIFIPKIISLHKLIPYTMSSIYTCEAGLVEDIYILKVDSLSMARISYIEMISCLTFISNHDITDLNIIMEYINIKYSEMVKEYVNKKGMLKDPIKSRSKFSFNKIIPIYLIKLKNGGLLSGIVWELFSDTAIKPTNKEQSIYYELSKLYSCETYGDMIILPVFSNIINQNCSGYCFKCGCSSMMRSIKVICEKCGYNNSQIWAKKIQDDKTLNIDMFSRDEK